MRMSSQQQNEERKPGVVEYACDECEDKEFIFYVDDEGYSMGKPCSCRERKAWSRRFKNAFIPEEFTRANLDNYQQDSSVQKTMLQLTEAYLAKYPESSRKLEGMCNFGLIANIGEQLIRSLPDADRAKAKTKHNNFGVGKTHLQIALSKQLIKRGFNVLVISDVSFMDEMMNARRMNDENETFNGLLHGVMTADVLMWDDIGKARPTEAKEALYYNIINERYKKQKPIIFNSNEDRGTLADRIGYAASSRLIGNCYDAVEEKEYLLEVEGEDWRLKKK